VRGKAKPIFFAFLIIFLLVVGSVLMFKQRFLAISSSSSGEMIGIIDVDVQSNSNKLQFVAEWIDPNTGTTLTQANWTYSASIYFKSISEANVTIRLEYKLDTETTWMKLDEQIWLGYQPPGDGTYKFEDTGLETIDTHTDRLISNPQDGTIYNFDYRVYVYVEGKGSKSGEIIVSEYTSDILVSTAAKYVAPPGFTKIDYDGTDVTEKLQDNSDTTSIATQYDGVSQDFTIKVTAYVYGDWSSVDVRVRWKVTGENNEYGTVLDQCAINFDSSPYSLQGDMAADEIRDETVWAHLSDEASDGVIIIEVGGEVSIGAKPYEIILYELQVSSHVASWIPIAAVSILAIVIIVVVVYHGKARRVFRSVMRHVR